MGSPRSLRHSSPNPQPMNLHSKKNLLFRYSLGGKIHDRQASMIRIVSSIRRRMERGQTEPVVSREIGRRFRVRPNSPPKRRRRNRRRHECPPLLPFGLRISNIPIHSGIIHSFTRSPRPRRTNRAVEIKSPNRHSSRRAKKA